MNEMFTPFKMPDFCARPEGISKSLKDTYINLKRLGFPDKDIFIYAQGEFNKFKGDVIDQQPHTGDMVYPGDRITLVAAVSGISHIMPDLFTAHMDRFQTDNIDSCQGAKNLFAIFDSMFLKILCRLEWIRDIYAGIYQSSQFIDYLNSIFFTSEIEDNKLNYKSLDFILARLSRFQGTENALRVFFESTTGLKVDAEIMNNQKTAIPADTVASLGDKSRLGEDIFLGEKFESEKPELKLNFKLDGLEDVQKAMKIAGDEKILEDIFRLVLPYYIQQCTISVEPVGEEIEFVNGNSYLGFSTALKSDDRKRS